MRWFRVVLAAVLAEVIGIAALVAQIFVVFGAGITTLGTIELQLQRQGLWIGTIAGFFLCLLGGWWAGRKSEKPLENGVRVGLLAGIIELVVLISAGAPVGRLMLLFFVSRVLGGYIGGRLGSRRVAGRDPLSAT